MPKPILLSSKTRSLWASSPSDVSTVLINMMTVITEALSKKGIKENSKEQLFISEASERIINLLSTENFNKSAVIGAYYRSLKYHDLVTMTTDDLKSITEVLQSIGIQENAEEYLKSFYRDDRSPRDAHVAFLKSFLFNIKHNLLAEVKDKYNEPINNLIDATLNVVEFMNTPFSVLDAEATINKKTNSGIDLQWTTMQKALEAAMDALIKAKTNPSENMKGKVWEIKRDLLKFQGAFGIQNTRYEGQNAMAQLQEKHKAISERYETLAHYVFRLSRHTSSNQFNPEEDLQPYIQQYGQRWKQICEKQKANKPDEQLKLELQETKRQLRTAIDDILRLTKEKSNLLEQEIQLKDQVKQLIEIESLHQTKAGPNTFTKIIDWINSLLETIKELSTTNAQLIQQVAVLKRENQNLKKNPAIQEELTTAHSTNKSLTTDFLSAKFASKFANTNSTGVKEIMTFITYLQEQPYLEDTKLDLLRIKMVDIASARKDNAWSNSSFFGAGRQPAVKQLYELLTEPNFSLTNTEKANGLLSILRDNESRPTAHSSKKI